MFPHGINNIYIMKGENKVSMNDSIKEIMPMQSIIDGYKVGANISLLNVIYIDSKKQEESNRYDPDVIYIIYKDLDTMEKKAQMIEKPKIRYYITKPGIYTPYNQLYIEADKVRPITCRYKSLKESIAKETGNEEWFKNNISSGNYKELSKLFEIPSIFGADINIEDFYRYEFARLYQNNPYPVTELYLDIEVDITPINGDFPTKGNCPVNAITLVDQANSKVYTLLLDDESNLLIEEFKHSIGIISELKQFIQKQVGGKKQYIRFGLDKFEYKIIFFTEEINLISSAFQVINTFKPDFVLCWNMAFDIPYLIDRITVLGYNPISVISSNDFKYKHVNYYIDSHAVKFEERTDESRITTYSVYLDQLISFASRRKGQRMIGSYKLDDIGELCANVKKLDYSNITTNIMYLPKLDYKTFVFYNIMDTIVQLCIEHNTGDMEYIFNKTLSTNTRYSKIFRQTVYLKNRFMIDLTSYGYVIGCNANKRNEKGQLTGALVADPVNLSDKAKLKLNDKPVEILYNLIDLDYSSLYPSCMDQNNMSPTTMYGKILFSSKIDPRENRLHINSGLFDRSVSFVEDLLSTNYLDFCHRYLGLPTYEEMYKLIYEYFTKVKYPIGDLNMYDSLSNKIILCHNAPKGGKELLCRSIKKGEKIQLVQNIQPMPKIDMSRKRDDS